MTFVRLSNLSLTDAGEYRCEANNTRRLQTKKSFISVSRKSNKSHLAIVFTVLFYVIEYPETHIISLVADEVSTSRTVTAIVGDRVTLRCEVTGYPIPVVSWTVADDQSASAIPGVDAQDHSVLLINTTTKKHNNNYTCRATNRVATVTSTIQVIVVECISRTKGCSSE